MTALTPQQDVCVAFALFRSRGYAAVSSIGPEAGQFMILSGLLQLPSAVSLHSYSPTSCVSIRKSLCKLCGAVVNLQHFNGNRGDQSTFSTTL